MLKTSDALPTETELTLLIHDYLTHLAVRLYSRWTVQARKHQLARFQQFCATRGVMSVKTVRPKLLTAYQAELCNYRKRDGTPFASDHMLHLLCAVNGFFKWLVRKRVIRSNPAADLELPRKERRLPRVILTHREIERVLHAPDISTPKGLRDRAILETLYSTGIRRMELCRLNLEHLDSAQRIVRVEQGKGGKDRLVPIGERALDWLQRYLLETRPRFGPGKDESAIFLNGFGWRLSEQCLGHLVRRTIQASGISKQGGCHLFRHAFATGLLRNGCDLRNIQEMLGHVSLETTQLYTHLNIGQIQQAHRRYHPASRTGPRSHASHLKQLRGELNVLSLEEIDQVLEFVRQLKDADQTEPQSGPPNGFAVGSKTPICDPPGPQIETRF